MRMHISHDLLKYHPVNFTSSISYTILLKVIKLKFYRNIEKHDIGTYIRCLLVGKAAAFLVQNGNSQSSFITPAIN